LSLSLVFLRLGATAFGGLAIIEYFHRVAVKQKRWLDEDSFNYGVAVSQAIPGPPTAKVAAYIGLRTRGVIGAALVLTAYILPTFLLMLILSVLYEWESGSRVTAAVFSGLQVVIAAIIVDTIFSFGKSLTRTAREIAIAIVAAVLFALKLHPIAVIIIAAGLGILIYDREPFKNLKPSEQKTGYPFWTAILTVLLPALSFALLFFLDRKLFTLSAVMFRIGLFSFGGGFGAIPLMLHEVIQVHSWMDAKTLMNGIALGQITPGPISITATFIGYIVDKMPGAFLATISIFYPTLMLMVVAVPYFDKLTGSKHFNKAVGGVLCSFVGLFLWVAVSFGLNIKWDLGHILLGVAAFLAMRLKIEVIWVVLAGVVISVLIF